MSDGWGSIIGAAVTVVALIVAIVLLANGFLTFGAANYLNNPIEAIQDQVSGLLQIGIGSVILLVLIGGIAAVAAILGFIRDVADQGL